jgi:hypothetical protein
MFGKSSSGVKQTEELQRQKGAHSLEKWAIIS